MPNIPYITPSTLSADPSTAELAERIATRRIAHGHKEGLVELDRILLHAPSIASGWNDFLGAVRTRTSLSDDVREVIICRVAVLNGAEYEWGHHAPILREALLPIVREESLGEMEQLEERTADPQDEVKKIAGTWPSLAYRERLAGEEEAKERRRTKEKEVEGAPRRKRRRDVDDEGEEKDGEGPPPWEKQGWSLTQTYDYHRWVDQTEADVDFFLRKMRGDVPMAPGVRDDMRGNSGLDAPVWQRVYDKVFDYVDAMTKDVNVPENVFKALRNTLSKGEGGDKQMVEITATCAAYNCVSRFLVAMNVGDMNK